DVVGPLAAARLLDDDGDQGHSSSVPAGRAAGSVSIRNGTVVSGAKVAANQGKRRPGLPRRARIEPSGRCFNKGKGRGNLLSIRCPGRGGPACVSSRRSSRERTGTEAAARAQGPHVP